MRYFIQVRWLMIAAVFFGVVGAVTMVVVGSLSTIDSVGIYLGTGTADAFSSEAALAVTVGLISALDQFLLGLVLLIFAAGVFELFIVADRDQVETEHARPPDWLKITSVTDLKVKLLEVIIVLLAVLALKGVLVSTDQLQWTDLVVPVTILFLALSVWLIKKAHKH